MIAHPYLDTKQKKTELEPKGENDAHKKANLN